MWDPGGAVLGAHIVSGALAVAAGAVALGARKGGMLHIGVGRVFTVAMILSSALGAGLGLMRIEGFYITFHAGVLGVTLILSSWLTVRTQGGRLGNANLAVGVVNCLNFAGLIAAGGYAQSLPGGQLLGFQAADYFYLSGMAGIAVAGDISFLFRNSLSDRHRIARHLWRMCLGFIIAAGSAFTGPGAKAFPEALQNSGILSAPELIILLLMLLWLARTLRRPAHPQTRGAP